MNTIPTQVYGKRTSPVSLILQTIALVIVICGSQLANRGTALYISSHFRDVAEIANYFAPYGVQFSIILAGTLLIFGISNGLRINAVFAVTVSLAAIVFALFSGGDGGGFVIVLVGIPVLLGLAILALLTTGIVVGIIRLIHLIVPITPPRRSLSWATVVIFGIAILPGILLLRTVVPLSQFL